MNAIIHRFTLDMQSAQSQISVPVMLNDTGRVFRIALAERGKPYHIEDGCYAAITFKRPNNTQDSQTSIVTDLCEIENNTTVVYDFRRNANVTAVRGIHDCDITLYDLDGIKVASAKFTMVVGVPAQYSVDNIAAEGDSDYLDGVRYEENIRIENEKTRVANENTRESAENVRVDNEEKREAAEAVREQNEIARIEANAVILKKAEEVKTLTETATKASEEATESATIATEKAEIAITSASYAEQSAIQAKASEEVAKTIASNSVNMEARISRNEKQITNILQGIVPDPFETDDSVAYVKDVPANALPYAEIEKVGGMTRKCSNLIKFPYVGVSTVLGGVNVVVHDDGSVHLNGTSDGNFNNFVFSNTVQFQHGKTYTAADNVIVSYKDATNTTQYATKTFVWDMSYTPLLVYFSIRPNTSYSLVVYPMLNEGATALPYELYFDGLRDVKVTEIEIVGKNLYDVNKFAEAFPNNIKIENGVVSLNSFASPMYSVGVPVDIQAGHVISLVPVAKENQSKSGRLKIVFEDGNFTHINITGANSETLGRQTLAVTKPVVAICFDLVTFNNGYSFKNFQIEKGDTTTEYTPFTKHTLPIPDAVQDLDDYGEGLNSTYSNVLDFTNQKYTRMVRRLLPSEKTLRTVTDYVYSNIVYFQLPKSGTADKGTDKSNILVSNFELYKGTNSWDAADRIGTVTGASTYDWYWFGFPVGTTLEQAQAVVDQSDILVTLKSAEIRSIADILTADNFIEVEGNGTITLVNEYGYDVPSEITYMIKEVTA